MTSSSILHAFPKEFNGRNIHGRQELFKLLYGVDYEYMDLHFAAITFVDVRILFPKKKEMGSKEESVKKCEKV